MPLVQLADALLTDLAPRNPHERVRRAVAVARATTGEERRALLAELAADPVTAGAYGPLVVHRDEFVARYLRGSTLQWVLVPDPVTVASKDLPAVGEAIAHLRNAGIPGPDGAWFPVVRTELDDLAERLRTTRVVSRSGLLLPVLLVLVIAGYVLLLIARL